MFAQVLLRIDCGDEKYCHIIHTADLPFSCGLTTGENDTCLKYFDFPFFWNVNTRQQNSERIIYEYSELNLWN